MVSICMLTFNHAKYLRKTFDGILNQKTGFGFEILVHDDASTDGTQEIIREYQKRYPRIVKPIFQEVNQWSRGVNPSIAYNYPRANAKYVAWCEGDDMWTDCEKLAIQIEELQKNPTIGLSFHQAVMLHYGQRGVKPILIGNYSNHDRIVPFQEVVYRPQGLIPTASCIVRQDVKQKLYDFMKLRPYMRSGDVFMQLFGSMGAGALYHARPMSIYRFQTPHSLTRGIRDQVEKQANHQAAVIRAYIELNKLTAGTISEELRKLIFQRILWLFGRKSIPTFTISELNLNTLAREYIRIKKQISRKARELNSADSEIVIFGCASGCALIIRRLDPEKVSCIIDRDGIRSGEELFGKPVFSLGGIGMRAGQTLVVSTLSHNRSELEKAVVRQGFPAERICYFFDEIADTIDIDALSEDHGDSEEIHGEQRLPGWWPRRLSPNNSARGRH